jgi:uncharacterized membrane protein YphA (DoxX/SURF4 family)
MKSNALNGALWVVQIMLALLFLFAGVVKFTTPVEQMAKQLSMPGWFLHFIGAVEILGAIGLILPRLLGIRPALTPLAAACLVVIMIGATVVTWHLPGSGPAIPFTTGILCAFVAYGRWRLAP